MKKAFLFACSLFFVAMGFTQDTMQYIRPSSIGISFVFYDFVTAQRIKASSLSTVLREKQSASFEEMGVGISLSYYKGLREKLDFAGSFSFASTEYTLPNTGRTVSNNLLLQADASFHFKMLPDKYFLLPYVSAGAGVNKIGSYYGAYMPLGVGFRLNFFDEASVFVNAKYHVPITDETVRSHFIYGFGIAGIIGKRANRN